MHMATREFHLGDILTITHDRMVSPRHMDGVYDILRFMTDDDVFTHQISRVIRECAPHLLRQLPFLAAPEVRDAANGLAAELGTDAGLADPGATVAGWLAGMVARHGATHPVSPIPADDHDRIDPYDELVVMRGTDEGIVIV